MIRLGLISDTHGLLRPEAIAFLRGSDFIVHAGDICEPGLLERLAEIAPVTAVRGNNDVGPWAERLGETALLQVGGVSVLVVHDLNALGAETSRPGVRAVIHGHSHKPATAERGGVLYVNPGSAGPRRFSLPISIGDMCIDGDAVSARTVILA